MKCDKCDREAAHQLHILAERPKAPPEGVSEWKRAFLERRGVYPTRREALRHFGYEEVELVHHLCYGHRGWMGIPVDGYWRVVKRQTMRLEER